MHCVRDDDIKMGHTTQSGFRPKDMVQIRHLACLGGGALWPVTLGAVSEMIRLKALRGIESFIGVSCSAMIVCVLAARMVTMDDTQLIQAMERDIETICTRSLLMDQPNLNLSTVLEYGTGVFRADNLVCFIRNELQHLLGNADATLLDLRNASGIDVGVLVLECGRPRLLDASSHPSLPVWMAVRASCSLRPLISAVRLRGNDEAWWLDPAIDKTSSQFVMDIIRARGGRYAVVSVAGDRLPPSWAGLPHRFSASYHEFVCIWAMSFALRFDHCLRSDPWVICTTTHDSFVMNFGLFTVSKAALFRGGARSARVHIQRWRAWPAVPGLTF